MKKVVYILIGLATFLSGCGTLEISFDVTPASAAGASVTATPEPETKPTSLSFTSTSTEIQVAMLESATKWITVWMDGVVTWYDPTDSGQPPQTFHEQVWIDHSTGRFRILQGSGEAMAETFKVSDGLTILEMDLTTGQSRSRPLPESARESHYVPPLEPDASYPNPLWGQIGTPLSELIFSADRAQNQGTFKPVAIEKIAGKQTLAVEWTYTDNQQPSFRAWLDVETAVILKLQEFGKGSGDKLQSERVVNQVVYDASMSDNLFDLQFSEMPSFSDISGNPLAVTESAPMLSADDDSLGQVYFFIFNHEYGNETTKLVRLPGSCVAGVSPCPQVEDITLPYPIDFSMVPLAWSPDGRFAAFYYGSSLDEGLFLFKPEDESWSKIVDLPFIDPPIWSSDGNWLAFRSQDGYGGDDIYVVRRDGNDLVNMTASEKLPPEGRPYILSGWINDNIILRSGNPGSEGLVYLRRVGDGFTKPLFDTPWTKSDMVPSPDGSFLAYPDFTDQNVLLKLLSPDGNTFRDLATFQSSSIYPIIWSPDGMQIAFARLAGFDSMSGQDVYIIGQDGRNLQQIYHSDFGSISTIVFSPDGQHLLIQDDDATGRFIYVINLSTLETHLLQAPSLPLDWWWLAPSWQP
jgi:WD40 repeat protein